MKPTAEQIINWGREALNKTGALIPTEWNIELLEAICSAAYEAGRKDEGEANKDRIETLYMMYKQASQQRNELAQQQTETLRARLAQPEPEGKYSDIVSDGGLDPRRKFDVAPQREWQGLTDKDIEACLEMSIHGTCRAIEAKLKEKNT